MGWVEVLSIIHSRGMVVMWDKEGIERKEELKGTCTLSVRRKFLLKD